MRSLRRRALIRIITVVGFALALVQPVLAQGNGKNSGSGGGGALGDVIIKAIKELLRILFSPIRTVIEKQGDAVLRTIVGTPHPDAVFSPPANNAWPNIYQFYWHTMIPLTLSLYGLSIGLVIFLESTSHLFSGYHRSKLKKRAFSGLLGILSWWWIAALSLRFIDALAGFLVPSVSNISLFQTLSFSGMGVLGVVATMSTDLTLFVLVGLIYLVRQLVLYLFVLLMPLLIVFWIPGVGPFELVSRFMKKLAGFYVPFLFMTVPVALLFRLGGLLGASANLSAGGFGAWLTALVIPVVAVVSPLVLFWQAGALFFMADRASQHVSAQRAKARLVKGRGQTQTGKQGGKNFVRGIRGKPAATRSGQYVLDSGDSRAHATGKRLNKTGTQLRSALSNRRNGGGEGGGGGRGGSGRNSASTSSVGERSSDGREYDRTHNHDNIRDPDSRSPRRESGDDQPRYIQ